MNPSRETDQSTMKNKKITTQYFTSYYVRCNFIYIFITILVGLSSRYSFVEIRPELQRNILKFGYGINYKYEGMLAHSFDRFYVITKFILPTLGDLKLSPIRYDKECNYLRNLDDEDNDKIKENIKDLLFYCSNVIPYMALYKYANKCTQFNGT